MPASGPPDPERALKLEDIKTAFFATFAGKEIRRDGRLLTVDEAWNEMVAQLTAQP